jgi:hypothetical protein
MLVLRGTEKLNTMFAELLTNFRRTQVSRFPIEVLIKHENSMVFVDSRFPVAHHEMSNVQKILGSVWSDDKGRVVVESRLIQNEKYNMHNTEYHTRKTQDPRKALKYMKEYLKPYTAQEIANRTMQSAKQAFSEHKDKVLWKARDYKLTDMDVLYEEVMHMKMLGYEPKTNAVKKLIDEGFPALEQYMKTKDTEFPRVHVHIAPDESVTIAVLAKQSNLEMGAYTHDSLAAAPTFIQQQVGLLKMMDKNTHVPDVGYKSSDTEFWIEGFSQ